MGLSSPRNLKGRCSVEGILPEASCSSRGPDGPVGDVTADNRRLFQEKKIFVLFPDAPFPVPRLLTGVL